jgi:hypothetical protein
MLPASPESPASPPGHRVPRGAREAATFVFFLALALVATRPLGRDLFGQMPVGPDPLIDLWTVDWISGHLLSPDLFGGNIFHPFPSAVLYSDLSLGTAVLVAPLRPLLRDPVPAYNVSLLLALAFGGWAFARLATALTGRTDAGLLAGTLAAFGSHQMAHVYHLNLASTGFIALFVLGLLRLYERPGPGPVLLAGPIFWAMEDSPQVLRFYRDWIADAPNELTTIVVHRRAPSIPIIPAELQGRQVVTIGVCYTGPIEDAERVVQPMREFGSPLLDLCRPSRFTDLQAMFDTSAPPGWWYYFRSCDVAELSDGVIDILAEHAPKMKSPVNFFPIFQLGGAVARVDDDETPFNGRKSGHSINLNATTVSAEGFDEERAWSRGVWEALVPYHAGVYVNFLVEEGEERVREAYGPVKYDRLKALKRKYDPGNLFRLNQNIRPD